MPELGFHFSPAFALKQPRHYEKKVVQLMLQCEMHRTSWTLALVLI